MTSPLLSALPWFDWLLVVGATLRLTRFVISDDLGVRLLRNPIEDFLIERLRPTRHWLAEGLSCPFCVGFWIGALVLVLTVAATFDPAPVRLVWEAILAALTLNYLAAHVGSRLDPNYDGDDTPTTEGDQR
jgi:hypothetical protein